MQIEITFGLSYEEIQLLAHNTVEKWAIGT